MTADDPIQIEASRWMTRLEGPVDEKTFTELEQWTAQSPRRLRTFVDYLALDVILVLTGKRPKA